MKKYNILICLIIILLLSSSLAVTGCSRASEETEPTGEVVQSEGASIQPSEIHTISSTISYVEITIFLFMFLLVIGSFLLLKKEIKDVQNKQSYRSRDRGNSFNNDTMWLDLDKRISRLALRIDDIEKKENSRNKYQERKNHFETFNGAPITQNQNASYQNTSNVSMTPKFKTSDIVEAFNYYKGLNDKDGFRDLFKSVKTGVENYNENTNYSLLSEIILSEKSDNSYFIIIQEQGTSNHFKVVPEIDALVKSRMIDYYKLIFDIDSTIDEVPKFDAFELISAAEAEMLVDGRYKVTKKGMIITR